MTCLTYNKELLNFQGHECGVDSARDNTTRLCSQEETLLPMDNQKAKTTTTTLKDHGNGAPSAVNDTVIILTYILINIYFELITHVIFM